MGKEANIEKWELRRELRIIEHRLIDKGRGDAIKAFKNFGQYIYDNCTKEALVGHVLSGYEHNNLEDCVIEVHGTKIENEILHWPPFRDNHLQEEGE